jgi:hypothetical protein
MFEFQYSNQTLGFSLLEVQENEETILERQVLEVVRVIFSSYIKDLGKLMDKPIACILFFATLELNIVDKENKKQDAIHVGQHIDPSMINPSQMQIVIFK